MDKIAWLQQMVTANPHDANSHYWLGKEYSESGKFVEALGCFTEALKYANDETRLNIIEALTETTLRMQQGSTSVQSSPPLDKAERIQSEYEDEEEQYPDFDEKGEEYDVATGGEQFQVSKRGLQVITGGNKELSPPRGSNKITFDDVAGLHDLKKVIRMRIISPFQNKSLFAKFRKKSGGGVLLYGPPGCGKTFIARATAGECNANFINVHITDILNRYIGVSEANLKDMFDKARRQKPSIMFFDEVDAIGANRSRSSEYMRGTVDTFLSEMEGIDTDTEQVLIIGATNMPWDVDNALKRPGRFDRLVFVAPPDMEARMQMFALKLDDRLVGKIDFEKLAKMTDLYSGADIENICERAVEIVLEEILDSGVERPVQMKDLERAIAQSKPSTLEWLRTVRNYVKYANQSGIYNDCEDFIKRYGRNI